MVKTNERKDIYVYADWKELGGPQLMGTLAVSAGRGNEVFSFEYDKNWLEGGHTHQLDPELQLYSGDQYTTTTKKNFGLFTDSCPDRWGRMLMSRREAILARQEGRSVNKLYESDFLFGVFDGNRMGGLRFKLGPEGEFLNSNRELATPHWARIKELEHASLKLEEEGIEETDEYLKWLNMLISPGSSLGGARPKANIVDDKNNLWIAKFPSKIDDVNVGGWEMVAYKIALEAGVVMSESRVQKFNSTNYTFITKRFDRDSKNNRFHFASAMTCLGLAEGDAYDEEVSYLDIAAFISREGCNIKSDLEQLWRRIILHIFISNVDDHLRNHGFILTKDGWNLSPAYDINPVHDGSGLKINISEQDNSQSIELALSVIKYFRITPLRANEIVSEVKTAVLKWREHANNLNISKGKQDLMKRAFRVAEE